VWGCVKLSHLVAIAFAVAVSTVAFEPAVAAEGRSATKSARKSVSAKSTRSARAFMPRRIVRVQEPPRLSFGQIAGLHGADDPLELKSSVALVLDQETNEVLFSKNPRAVLPIASITKLMTAPRKTTSIPRRAAIRAFASERSSHAERCSTWR